MNSFKNFTAAILAYLSALKIVLRDQDHRRFGSLIQIFRKDPIFHRLDIMSIENLNSMRFLLRDRAHIKTKTARFSDKAFINKHGLKTTYLSQVQKFLVVSSQFAL